MMSPKLLSILWSGTSPPTDPDTKYSHSTRLTKPSIIVIAFLIDIQWSKPAQTTLGFWKAFRCNYQLHTPALYKGSTKRHGYYCVNWAGRIYWVFACHTVLQECHHGSADLAGVGVPLLDILQLHSCQHRVLPATREKRLVCSCSL